MEAQAVRAAAAAAVHIQMRAPLLKVFHQSLYLLSFRWPSWPIFSFNCIFQADEDASSSEDMYQRRGKCKARLNEVAKQKCCKGRCKKEFETDLEVGLLLGWLLLGIDEARTRRIVMELTESNVHSANSRGRIKRRIRRPRLQYRKTLSPHPVAIRRCFGVIIIVPLLPAVPGTLPSSHLDPSLRASA